VQGSRQSGGEKGSVPAVAVREVRGIVVQANPDQGVRVRTADGNERQIPWKEGIQSGDTVQFRQMSDGSREYQIQQRPGLGANVQIDGERMDLIRQVQLLRDSVQNSQIDGIKRQEIVERLDSLLRLLDGRVTDRQMQKAVAQVLDATNASPSARSANWAGQLLSLLQTHQPAWIPQESGVQRQLQQHLAMMLSQMSSNDVQNLPQDLQKLDSLLQLLMQGKVDHGANLEQRSTGVQGATGAQATSTSNLTDQTAKQLLQMFFMLRDAQSMLKTDRGSGSATGSAFSSATASASQTSFQSLVNTLQQNQGMIQKLSGDIRSLLSATLSNNMTRASGPSSPALPAVFSASISAKSANGLTLQLHSPSIIGTQPGSTSGDQTGAIVSDKSGAIPAGSAGVSSGAEKLQVNLNNTPWQNLRWFSGQNVQGEVVGKGVFLNPVSQGLPEDLLQQAAKEQVSITPSLRESFEALKTLLPPGDTPDLSWVRSAQQLFQQAEALLPQQQELSKDDQNLLLRWLLSRGGESSSDAQIRNLLEHNRNPDRSQQLWQNLSPESKAWLEDALKKPMNAREFTERLEQWLRQNPGEHEDKRNLEQLLRHAHTRQFDQDTRHPQERQENFYWANQQGLHQGGLKVRDERKTNSEGKTEGGIQFRIETRTPHMGHVSAQCRAEEDKLDIRLEDETGHFLEGVQAEREELRRELEQIGYVLKSLIYRKQPDLTVKNGFNAGNNPANSGNFFGQSPDSGVDYLA